MTDDELSHALKGAELVYRSAQKTADEYKDARNKLVRRALRRKWTHARISESTRSDPENPKTGLTRGRINQLRSP